MTIKHILKNGTILTDINGHVVKMEDVRTVYDLMDRINQNGKRKGVK